MSHDTEIGPGRRAIVLFTRKFFQGMKILLSARLIPDRISEHPAGASAGSLCFRTLWQGPNTYLFKTTKFGRKGF